MPNHLELVRRAAEALRTRERAVDEARENLHRRIIDAAEAGESKSAIARAASVSRQWVGKVLGTS
jgi:DNA invertase Pin-like site-specific DNA recombinase